MNSIERFSEDFQKTVKLNKEFLCQMKRDGDNEFVIHQVIYNRMDTKFMYHQHRIAYELFKEIIKLERWDSEAYNRAKNRYDQKLYIINEQRSKDFGLGAVLTPEQIKFIEFKAKKKAYRDYFAELMKVASRIMISTAKNLSNYRD